MGTKNVSDGSTLLWAFKMNLVKLIREKGELVQLRRGDFLAWFEPKPRHSPIVESVHSKLYKKLNATTHIGEWLRVDQERVSAFAEATEDFQWIHVDQARAQRESPFQTTVAHGFLILALLPKLTNRAPYLSKAVPESKLIINCGLANVQFLYPVKTGAEIRTRTTLSKLIRHKRSLDLVDQIVVELRRPRRIACAVESTYRLYF